MFLLIVYPVCSACLNGVGFSVEGSPSTIYKKSTSTLHFKGVVRSKSDFSKIEYVKVDGLGETLLFGREPACQTCKFRMFENRISQQNSLAKHDLSLLISDVGFPRNRMYFTLSQKSNNEATASIIK